MLTPCSMMASCLALDPIGLAVSHRVFKSAVPVRCLAQCRIAAFASSLMISIFRSAAEQSLRQRHVGTLSGLIRDFEGTKQWRRLADSTRKEYKRVFIFWDAEYGTCPHRALEDKAFRADIVKWHDKFSEEKPREADNRVAILGRVLSWAAKDGPLRVNVLDGFERAYASDRSDIIWLPEHIEAFMAVASPEMQFAMVLALHTGQRQADILRLAWSQYDGASITLRQGRDEPKRLILTIRQGKTGFRTSTTMPAAVSVYNRILKRYTNSNKDDYLFLPTFSNRTYAKRTIQRQFNVLLERTGLKHDQATDSDHSVYSLRHTAICMRLVKSKGRVNIFNLAKTAGTSVDQIERFYTKHLALSPEMAMNLQSFGSD